MKNFWLKYKEEKNKKVKEIAVKINRQLPPLLTKNSPNKDDYYKAIHEGALVRKYLHEVGNYIEEGDVLYTTLNEPATLTDVLQVEQEMNECFSFISVDIFV